MSTRGDGATPKNEKEPNTNDAWIVDGVYERCDHSDVMTCGCVVVMTLSQDALRKLIKLREGKIRVTVEPLEDQ